MRKYRIGDFVKIRKNLRVSDSTIDAYWNVTDEMLLFRGDIGKIVAYDSDNGYRLTLDGTLYGWMEYMFEPYKKAQPKIYPIAKWCKENYK